MNSIPCDYVKIRASSLVAVKKLGYRANNDLPLLDEVGSLHSIDDILDRLLTLFGVVAHSYGFPANKAIAWLESEGLVEKLSPVESQYLKDGKGIASAFQCHVEALWSLAWIAGINQILDMGSLCSNEFIHSFPNLKTNEDSKAFRAKANIRSVSEIIQTADTAYCLHWAVRQAALDKAEPGGIPLYVVEQRRKALDWVLYGGDWDDVALDT